MARQKIKTAGRGEVRAEGATQKEANEKLEKEIDRITTGTYEPRMVSYGQYTALVFRTLDGWTYKLLDRHGAETFKAGPVTVWGGQSANPNLDAVMQDAAFHVLDIGGGREEFHTDADIPAWLTDKDKRSTILSNARFQRAYTWAKQNKPEGTEGPEHLIHRWACDHAHEARFA